MFFGDVLEAAAQEQVFTFEFLWEYRECSEPVIAPQAARSIATSPDVLMSFIAVTCPLFTIANSMTTVPDLLRGGIALSGINGCQWVCI